MKLLCRVDLRTIFFRVKKKLHLELGSLDPLVEGKKQSQPCLKRNTAAPGPGLGFSKFKMVVFFSSIQDGGLVRWGENPSKFECGGKTENAEKSQAEPLRKLRARSFFRNVGWKIRAPWISKRYPSSSSVEKSLWILSKNDWKEGLRPGNPSRRYMIVYTCIY